MAFLSPVKPIKDLAHKLEILIMSRLWIQVIIGLILGLLVGLVLGPDFQLFDAGKTAIVMEWFALPGYLFLQLIKMIVVPLVVASIIRGIGAHKDLIQLRTTGLKLMLYIVSTTLIAIGIGIFLSLQLQPGTFVDIPSLMNEKEALMPMPTPEILSTSDLAQKLPAMLIGLIPDNPFVSILNTEMLGIVVFSILIGFAFATRPKRKVSSMLNLLGGIIDISMTIVRWAMFLAPFAVFGLTAKMASQVGLKTLIGMSVYTLTVILGLFIVLILYYLIILLFRKNPLIFAKEVFSLQLLAFSTSSSAAVMPLSIRTAEEKLNVETETAELIIPIGATMNMAGTALYQSTALVFLAQIAGVSLTPGQLVIIALTLTASSIGAPGTPGVGVIILAAIAGNFGIPTGGMALILGVDRILDMFRTSLNVTGDLTACYILNKKKIFD